MQEACLAMIQAGLVKSAHDCSEGGLAVALAECSILSGNGLGAKVELDGKMRPDALLFGETQSRIIITLDNEDLAAAEKKAQDYEVPFAVIGKVEGQHLAIGRMIGLPVRSLWDTYDKAIERIMEKEREVARR